MTCIHCGKETIIGVSCKCSDMFYSIINGVEYHGYQNIPDVFGNEEDYVDFDFCSSCGRIQAKFPIDIT